MRPASIKETKNGYNDENYITPRTLRAALADYTPGGGGSSEGGTTDYNKLENKPSINGVTLSQNKTLKDLGIQPEGAYLTEVPDTYKTKDENDRLYQPKGSYQPAGSYQETLVSGDNIKTVNGQSLLGGGDLTIAGGGGGGLIDSLPVGTMIPYGSAETPDNWLSCNGQEVSRTTYSHLFKVIGTSYGAGDGSTTFNLPDKRGRVSVGYDPDQTMFNKVGAHVGANTHTLTVNEMPWHYHNGIYNNYSEKTVTTRGDGGGGYFDNVALINPDATLSTTYSCLRTGYSGGDAPFSIVQASEVDHWIIKAYPLSNADGYLDPLPVGTIVDYEGDEIPDGFEEVEEIKATQRWTIESEFKYNSITTNSWSLLSPFVETPVLPKGRYLAIYNVGIYNGGNSGVATINAGFNNSRLSAEHRASLPLLSTLITNTELSYYFELDEDKSVSFSAYAYCNIGCSVNSFRVDIIKLDSEEMGLVVDNAKVYSNEEQIIGTWNGKPLYRKKFEYMGLAMNVENVIGTIANADEVYIEEAHLITTNDAKLSYPLNMVGYAGNTTDKVYVYAQSGYIKVHTNGGWGSAWKVVVVAKYTKTTD